LGANLGEGIRALGLDIDATARATLLRFLALLAKWNRTYNLTAVREPERMITHHLLDSLAVLPYLPRERGLRLIDVGSGGGLPGIPLAIARPDWKITLLESNHKKSAFQRQAAIELPLANAETVTARAERYRPEAAFDAVISRAFADLATFASLARSLLTPSGRLYAMKGVYPREEIDHLPPEIRIVAAPAYAVPGLSGQRHVVIMEAAAA
jgi:16S rRNA (guanine527-N7)-methyltransferase